MVVDGPQLVAEGLGIRIARGLGPRSARREDRGLSAEQAVGQNSDIMVSEFQRNVDGQASPSTLSGNCIDSNELKVKIEQDARGSSRERP
jgi:hypothetical protein